MKFEAKKSNKGLVLVVLDYPQKLRAFFTNP